MVRGIVATIPELQGVLDRIADAIERAMGARPNVDITGKTGPFIPQDSPGSSTTPSTDRMPLPAVVGGSAARRAGLAFQAPLTEFAMGGLVLGPTLGLVGEAGPEMIIPLDRLDRLGGGDTYVINVSGALDAEGTARTILRTLRDAERRTGERLAV
jgi:hypothetical protein